MDVERTFPPEATSVPAVRRFVLGCLDSLSVSVRDKVSLLVSEVATNAVLYAQTPFSVSVQADEHRLVVGVTDAGEGTPEPEEFPEPTQPHGRGLLIVREMADDWGVTPRPPEPGKTVWFRFDHGVRETP